MATSGTNFTLSDLIAQSAFGSEKEDGEVTSTADSELTAGTGLDNARLLRFFLFGTFIHAPFFTVYYSAQVGFLAFAGV